VGIVRDETDTGLATPVRRLAAWVFDALITALALTPLNPILYSSRPNASLFFALWAPAMLLLLLYLALFDGGPRGATPGKRIVGIRVADAAAGGPIGYRRALIRRLGYFAGGLALYAGWLWLLLDPRRQAWHDKLAGSVVVNSR
jgi:uncharacterized RDD family membrane protein YckC